MQKLEVVKEHLTRLQFHIQLQGQIQIIFTYPFVVDRALPVFSKGVSASSARLDAKALLIPSPSGL